MMPDTPAPRSSDGPILVVEDDLPLRASLVEVLRDSGYRTLEAGSVQEARQRLREHRPAVCLLDLNLPDGNGLELLPAIAAAGLGACTIVMTAYPAQRHHGPHANLLAGWLAKPVEPGRLLARIAAALPGPNPDPART